MGKTGYPPHFWMSPWMTDPSAPCRHILVVSLVACLKRRATQALWYWPLCVMRLYTMVRTECTGHSIRINGQVAFHAQSRCSVRTKCAKENLNPTLLFPHAPPFPRDQSTETLRTADFSEHCKILVTTSSVSSPNQIPSTQCRQRKQQQAGQASDPHVGHGT